MRHLLIVIMAGLLMAGQSQATDYYVKTNGNDTANGTNWATALNTISNALAKATPTHVYVQNGTYSITNQIAMVNMTSGCQLLGGYNGTTPEPGTRGVDPASNCIIDAGTNCRVFYMTNCAAGTVIDGFTIQNGKQASGSGGGIYVSGSTNTISHNKIVRNTVSGAVYGGGIYIANSTVAISNNVIAGNASDYNGGGIHMGSGTILVNNNTIYSNTVINNGTGGGIYLNSGNSTIKNNIIAGNNIYGIQYVAGTVTFSYNDVWGNTISNYCNCSPGATDISRNPILVGGGDYHEQSQAGSWHGGAWTIDPNHSPCIDAGDPTSDYSLEPTPNGTNINMGAYGNTPTASKSIGYIPSPVPRYVRPVAEATPVWPYTNWAMAAGDIQTALNPADGQPVYVKVGTYNITNGYIAMCTAQLLGGYLGTGSPGSRAASPADACILDAKSSNRVFYCFGCNTGTVINGFTIQNGKNGGVANENGGGIYVLGSALTIGNNKILSNSLSGYEFGGGIYIVSSMVAISNNVIAGNSGSQSGGGIYNNPNINLGQNGIILVNNNTIYSNNANSGGGIYLYGGTNTIKNNIIVTNISSGIYLNTNAVVTVMSSYNDVWGNTVSNYYYCSPGTGDISRDPLLVNVGAGDYHEQSVGGSWHNGAWTADASNSPCLDAGDPASDYSLEPPPNGHRINMGAYGGTPQASKDYVPKGTIISWH